MNEAVMLSAHHEYCWNLLPWFVTGRVSASDARRIERHLEDCTACRTELEQQRKLCEHVRQDDAVLLAPQASLQKLLDRIDASVPDSQITDLDAVSDESDESPPQRRAPRWLAIAAAVQAIAIAGLLTLVWQQTSSVLTAPRFTTLTSASAQSDQAIIRIVFKPQTTTQQLQELLGSVHAQVVGGPTDAGVYTLDLDAAHEDHIAATLETLRADKNVLFAEHVHGGTP